MCEPLQAGVSLQCLFFGIPDTQGSLCRVLAKPTYATLRRDAFTLRSSKAFREIGAWEGEELTSVQ